jgi:DNA/RNA-binding domain of Phe-tRNA-synthetase-like protein
MDRKTFFKTGAGAILAAIFGRSIVKAEEPANGLIVAARDHEKTTVYKNGVAKEVAKSMHKAAQAIDVKIECDVSEFKEALHNTEELLKKSMHSDESGNWYLNIKVE